MLSKAEAKMFGPKKQQTSGKNLCIIFSIFSLLPRPRPGGPLRKKKEGESAPQKGQEFISSRMKGRTNNHATSSESYSLMPSCLRAGRTLQVPWMYGSAAVAVLGTVEAFLTPDGRFTCNLCDRIRIRSVHPWNWGRESLGLRGRSKKVPNSWQGSIPFSHLI